MDEIKKNGVSDGENAKVDAGAPTDELSFADKSIPTDTDKVSDDTASAFTGSASPVVDDGYVPYAGASFGFYGAYTADSSAATQENGTDIGSAEPEVKAATETAHTEASDTETTAAATDTTGVGTAGSYTAIPTVGAGTADSAGGSVYGRPFYNRYNYDPRTGRALNSTNPVGAGDAYRTTVPPIPPIPPRPSVPPMPPTPPKKQRSLMTVSLILTLIISLVFGTVGVAIGTGIASSFYGDRPPVNVTIESNQLNMADAELGSVTKVTNDCVNSVVMVTTAYIDEYGQVYGSGGGSGVIISSDGYVVTCDHVVNGASAIYVETYDGTQYMAEVVGGDSWSDIAVIKLETMLGNPVSGLPYKPFAKGNDDTSGSYMNLGDGVVVIGNPLGMLPWSVSSGVISGLDREITFDGITMSLTQMDAPVNPGNSGGAMFDMYGNLIGIVNGKTVHEQIEGIGYSIPSHTALKIVEELMKNGYVKDRPVVGITYAKLATPVTFGQYKSYFQITNYVFGDELKAGDYILFMDDREVTTSTDINTIMASKSAGDEIIFVVMRDYARVDVTVTVKASQDLPR